MNPEDRRFRPQAVGPFRSKWEADTCKKTTNITIPVSHSPKPKKGREHQAPREVSYGSANSSTDIKEQHSTPSGTRMATSPTSIPAKAEQSHGKNKNNENKAGLIMKTTYST